MIAYMFLGCNKRFEVEGVERCQQSLTLRLKSTKVFMVKLMIYAIQGY